MRAFVRIVKSLSRLITAGHREWYRRNFSQIREICFVAVSIVFWKKLRFSSTQYFFCDSSEKYFFNQIDCFEVVPLTFAILLKLACVGSFVWCYFWWLCLFLCSVYLMVSNWGEIYMLQFIPFECNLCRVWCESNWVSFWEKWCLYKKKDGGS